MTENKRFKVDYDITVGNYCLHDECKAKGVDGYIAYLSDEERANNLCDLLNEKEEQIKGLDSENKKLWETCYHTLQFARKEDITIKRNDKGHYKVYSKNVTPKDSPIISITAPSVLFNEYIINHIIEAIDKILPVQEKEE